MDTSCSSNALATTQVAERRRISHSGLLDSAIRMVAQLGASGDLTTRTLANRALADLQKLRHDIPKRRKIDARSYNR